MLKADADLLIYCLPASSSLPSHRPIYIREQYKHQLDCNFNELAASPCVIVHAITPQGSSFFA